MGLFLAHFINMGLRALQTKCAKVVAYLTEDPLYFGPLTLCSFSIISFSSLFFKKISITPIMVVSKIFLILKPKKSYLLQWLHQKYCSSSRYISQGVVNFYANIYNIFIIGSFSVWVWVFLTCFGSGLGLNQKKILI